MIPKHPEKLGKKFFQNSLLNNFLQNYRLIQNRHKGRKPKKLALIAVARKLLVIACAILNSQKPYEENHISCYNKNSVKIA